MLAKLTAKNQLTLPKAATATLDATEYFDVQTRDGVIILTPVRIQRADAVRAKLAELELKDDDIGNAVTWARKPMAEAGEPAKPATRLRKPAKRKP